MILDRSAKAGSAELYAARAAAAGIDNTINTAQMNTAKVFFIDKTPKDDVSYSQPRRRVRPRSGKIDLKDYNSKRVINKHSNQPEASFMVGITGDIHGDYSRFAHPGIKKLKKGDTLIICGDFGFIWDDSPRERKLLKKIGSKKYNVCFIDGTHENFDLLSKYPETRWKGGKVHQIHGNLYHLMRGQLFRFDSMTFFTMGGGESPDIDIRFENNCWSRLESPSREELLEGIANLELADCKADVIITHEPPQRIKGFLKLNEAEADKVTNLNSYLEELCNVCEYQRWFFGSMHLDKHISSTHIAVFQNVIDAATGKYLR